MTTGAGSSFPLTRLAARYNELRNNGQLLSNRRLVEIIDDRIVQLAGRIDVDEAPGRVSRLYAVWQEFKDAVEGRRDDDAFKAKMTLDIQFEKIYHDYAAWTQMFEAFDLRRKMAESEVKILKEIKGILSYEDAYELSAQLLAVTMRVIGDDPKKLKQVQYEYSRLIGEVSDNVTEGFIETDGGTGGEGEGE